jgi:flagellin-like hook-associated protein FlgL
MSLPSNITRVPNLLSSQVLLSNLTRTNVGLLGVQSQMATGRSVNRPSDDAVRASAIAVLDQRLERAEQRMANLGLASDTLSMLDTTLGEASEMVNEAIGIASSQIGITSDEGTREQLAFTIDGMIRQLVDMVNRETREVYIFGGSTPTRRPLEALGNGYRYVARGSGMINDLDLGEQIPITLGGGNPLGELSARLQSQTDLNPALTPDTRLASLNGGRGLGVTLGPVSFSFSGGPAATVDLTGADTAQDIADRLTAAIRQYETDNGVTILGPGGVSLSGGCFAIDVVAGGSLTFADVGSGVTGQDLGLTSAPFTSAAATGQDLNPRLTLLTPISALSGVTMPLGSIRIRFTSGGRGGSSFRDVDLSSATTIDDVRRLIEDTGLGVRVEVNEAGTGLNVFNEVAGPGMSIEELPGGTNTATELGIRSYSAETRIADFNDGRGVGIVDGRTNPVSGLVDPALNVDFTIRLGNGDEFTVDLRPQDMLTVQTVIDRINQEAAAAEAAGNISTGSFQAALTDQSSGITFTDPLGLGPISVERENNSPAAEDLGLLGGSHDATSAQFRAQDRAQIRVDSLITALMDLRDALRNNDSTGITLAGERLESHFDRVAQSRALVGVYSQRIERATERQTELGLLDERVRSELRDLDLAEASIRFNLLRTQLEAGLAAGAQSQTLTLLNFLR